jgi:hypothetical protein
MAGTTLVAAVGATGSARGSHRAVIVVMHT